MCLAPSRALFISRIAIRCDFLVTPAPFALQRKSPLRFFKTSAACLFLVFLFAASFPMAVLAQSTGPCAITNPGGLIINTIGCYNFGMGHIPHISDCMCGGRVDIQVQQKACANKNSFACADVAIDLIVSYTSNTANCGNYWPGFFPFFSCNGGNCVQDLSTRWTTPGGNDC